MPCLSLNNNKTYCVSQRQKLIISVSDNFSITRLKSFIYREYMRKKSITSKKKFAPFEGKFSAACGVLLYKLKGINKETFFL